MVNKAMIPADFIPRYPSLAREILWNRGIQSTSDAEKFLNPSLNEIQNPIGLLKDVEEALKILLAARDAKSRVVVFGDYDVDGTTSATLLLTAFRDFGFNAGYYIPHRIQEGYGVTRKAAESLLAQEPDVQLVVTCDCGVGSHEGIDFLRSKNIKVVVTDHHEIPSKRVSAEAVLNPKQKECAYPDKKLAGVGVAFLLVMALRRALDRRDYPLTSFLELVAVGTVCDVAELSGYNRVFVKLGLKRLENTERPGFRLLLRNNGLEGRPIKSRDLGFVIGPRLNAAGRVGNPLLGSRALLAATEQEAFPYVNALEMHNAERKRIQEEQLQECLLMAEELQRKSPRNNSFVLYQKHFHLGIVGLLAGRIAEKFQKPACVLTELVDEHALADFETKASLWKGSLRAPAGFRLSEVLDELKQEPRLLVSGGGHAVAAGVALYADQLEKFSSAFEAKISMQSKQELQSKPDAELLNVSDVSETLQLLEPFGNGNPVPLVSVKNFALQNVQAMKEIHLRLWGQVGRSQVSVLQFKSPWVKLFLGLERNSGLNGKQSGEKGQRYDQTNFDFLAELSENEWNGNKKVELLLKDILEVRVGGRKIETTEGRTQSATAASDEASAR